jgi:eukaryotic-like serine/threonine-protein kinase
MAEPLHFDSRAETDLASGVQTLVRGATSAPRAEVVAPGVCLAGRYLVEQRIGEGGMATVFAARHLELRQRVAIKVMKAEISADEDARSRFAREARAAASLHSANAVRVYDVGRTADDIPFLVMEYLDGSDLATVLEQRGPLPILDVLGYAIDACDALADAHALGLVHRDIKPQNLFLMRSFGSAPKVKVLDFGLAKSFVSSPLPTTHVTAAHVMIGSPFYMSPEQVQGLDLDPRTDVWSLAATMHALLTGHPPFTGANLPLLLASILQERPRPIGELRPDVPPALEALLLACMARDRTQRPMTIAHVQAELDEIRERLVRPAPAPPSGQLATTTPHPLSAPSSISFPLSTRERHVTTVPPPPGKKGSALAWLTVLALFAVVGTLGILFSRRIPKVPAPSAAEPPAVVAPAPAPAPPPPARAADEPSPAPAPSASAPARKRKVVAPYVPRRAPAPAPSPIVDDPYAHP